MVSLPRSETCSRWQSSDADLCTWLASDLHPLQEGYQEIEQISQNQTNKALPPP